MENWQIPDGWTASEGALNNQTFDLQRAKENHEITRDAADDALQQAYDRIKYERDNKTEFQPPAPIYSKGYRDGLETAMRIIGDMDEEIS